MLLLKLQSTVHSYKPNESSTYTILSNIYATKQLWSEVVRTRDFMKMTDVVKEPGNSWVEVK